MPELLYPQNDTGEEPREVRDHLGRPLRDLRISLTDRCNFRCRYCMPKEKFGPGHAFLPTEQLLTFAEITRLANLFRTLGMRKIRLTGGEPLLRSGVDDLIRSLAAVGADDIALTTNGSLLTDDLALRLHGAGLRRITISLDALNDDVFMAMNDVRFPVSRVLAAIQAAAAVGFAPIKVNMVVKRGWNENEVLAMAEHFRDTGIVLRFIEYMDVGNSNGWRMDDVVTAEEILALIRTRWSVQPIPAAYPGEVAQRFEYLDGGGEFGIIASVTQAFCGACTRARLSPEGRLFTCLFGTSGFDLRSLLRGEATDADIVGAMREHWEGRADRYSELRSAATQSRPKVEMSYIGG